MEAPPEGTSGFTVNRPSRQVRRVLACAGAGALLVGLGPLVSADPVDHAPLAGVEASSPRPAPSRDPWLRPFASDSIWNTAIGSEAILRPAAFPYVENNALDRVYLRRLDAADPEVPLVHSGGWRHRCTGTEESGFTLNLPPDYMIPPPRQRSDGGWDTPNNGFAFLLPDGRIVHNGGEGARCREGGPLYGHDGTPESHRTDLYGDGIAGGHGASRMSNFGGAIRPGELSGPDPVRHVLDLVLNAEYLYSDGKVTRESTYRWPATSSDGYALDRSKTDSYVGDDPELRMGSLLALPSGLAPADIGVDTDVGRRLFQALKDYGAYVTEDSAWDANYLVVDAEAEDTFAWGDAEQDDFGRLVEALHVVVNNGPDSIGGGGVPRRPPLPELPDPPYSLHVPDELVERLVDTVLTAIGRTA